MSKKRPLIPDADLDRMVQGHLNKKKTSDTPLDTSSADLFNPFGVDERKPFDFRKVKGVDPASIKLDPSVATPDQPSTPVKEEKDGFFDNMGQAIMAGSAGLGRMSSSLGAGLIDSFGKMNLTNTGPIGGLGILSDWIKKSKADPNDNLAEQYLKSMFNQTLDLPNTIEKTLNNDRPVMDASDFAKKIEDDFGIEEKYNPFSPNNGAAAYFKKVQKNNHEKAYANYEGGIWQALKNGEWGKAGKLAALGTAESLPIMVGLAATRGAGASAGGSLGAMGLGTMEMEYEDLKKSNPEIPKNILLANAIITGASEAGSELLGTSLIYDQAMRLFKSGAKEKGIKVLRTGLKGYMDAAFRKAFVGVSALDEGSTEAVNQIVKNAVDKWSGVRPDAGYTDGAMDAFLVGNAAGGVFSAPFVAASKVYKAANKKTVRSLSDQNSAIGTYLEGQNISPATKEKLISEVAANTEKINDIFDQDEAEAKKLSPSEKTKVESINKEIDQKEQIIADPSIPSTIRDATTKAISELEAHADEVLKEAEARAETIEKAKDGIKTASTPEQIQKQVVGIQKVADVAGATLEFQEAVSAASEKVSKLKKDAPTGEQADKVRNDLLRELSDELDALKVKPAAEEAINMDAYGTPLMRVKDGVDRIFKNNKSLSDVGTPQEYSEYLESIFPDSKVKDVVFHGTKRTFDTFDNEQIGTENDAKTNGSVGLLGKGFYFSKNYDSAEGYSLDHEAKKYGNVKSAIVNVRDINADTWSYNTKAKNLDEVVARSSEDIHILGTPTDIENFKTWKENKNNEPTTEIQGNKESGANPVAESTELPKPEVEKTVVKKADRPARADSGVAATNGVVAPKSEDVEAPPVEILADVPALNDQIKSAKISGRLFNAKQSEELQKEIEDNYLAGVSSAMFNGRSNDLRTGVYNYDTPIAQKTSNGVDLRITPGLVRNKAKTYLLYADGKVAGEFGSVDDAKTVVKFIENNLVKPVDAPKKATIKEIAKESPNMIIGKVPKNIKVGSMTYTKIGKNAEGETLYENPDGVRTKEASDTPGIYSTEPVAIIPGRGTYVDKARRSESYKTTDELTKVPVKSKEDARSVRDEKIEDDIDAAFKDFAKSLGKTLGSNALSSESIEKGLKLVSLYTKKGVYKFSDMIEDAYERFGDQVRDIVDGLKAAYSSYYSTAEDEIADQMTDPKELRKFNIDELIKNENGTTRDGDLPDTVRNNEGAVVSPEQTGGTQGVVSKQEAENVPVSDSGTGVQDGGGSDVSGNEGGRSSGSDQRTAVGAGTGDRPAKSAKSKGTTDDNGGSGQLKPENQNMIIPEGMVVVPDGPVAKVTANMNAMLLLNKLEEENRNPTPQEKEVLVKFVGWGGLSGYLDGDKDDGISKAIFSGKTEKLNYYNEFTPSKALSTEGKTFEQILEDFRKAYQDAISDYSVKRYSSLQYEDKVSLDFARKQVVSQMLSEDEFNSAKVSTENAHYTEGSVIRAMWDLAKDLGFDGGTILESSAGIGHFFGMMPADIAANSTGIGVELDSLTGRMMKKLYPQNQTYIRGFQDVNLSNNSVDLAIGNVPFASTGRVYDTRNKDIQKFSLHNYFIAKNLRLLKPGGIAVLITSKATLDNPSSASARRWFASTTGGNSDLVGAVRLPNNAFDKNAGTQVTTDVLVFRKRSSDIANTQPFFSTVNIRSEMVEDRQGVLQKADIDINEYYINHPDNMIGEMMYAKEAGSGGLYSEFDPTLRAPEGTDVVGRLKEAFATMPKGIYKAEPTDTQEKEVKIFSEEKSGKVFMDKKGEIYVSEGEEAVPANLRYKTHVEAVKEYIPLRDAIYPLLEAELSTKSTDEDIEAKRKDLNKVYDAFVKKHGSVSKHSGWLFQLDVDYPLVAALENVKSKSEFNQVGKLVRTFEVSKGDILTQRVNFPISIPSKADNYDDAVKISVSYKGFVDDKYVAELMKTDEKTAREKMLKENLVFENPTTGILETNDSYLGGKVRTKLIQAKEALQENSAYQRNVDALEDVQPKLIPAGGIDFKIGVGYLPAKIYEQFISDTLGVEATLDYIDTIGQWNIQKAGGVSDARNTQTYAVQGHTGIEILADAITNRTTTIYRWVDKNTKVVDEAATSAAADMQDRINTEFQRYVKNNEEFRDILEQEYNNRFNNYVEPKTSMPTFKHFPGAVTSIQLREHQMKAILRAVAGNTLFAHQVGTGKTFSLITSAMELRRLGLAKKPMIVVKNSTLNDFASSFKKLYPTAKLLILSKDEINAKNRKLFMGRIPSSDWDAVIIPHSQFNMIPDRPERVRGYLQEKIEELKTILSGTDDRTLKQRLTKEVESLEEQMDMMLLSKEDRAVIKAAGDEAGKKESSRTGKSKAKKEGERIARLTAAVAKVTDRKTDNILDFEDMGVDALLLDESQEFKRLGFSTNISKVKGIDIAASKKAVSAYLKTQAVMERTGGKNVIFATGTPVTNTMAELWTNMRYMIPDVIKDMGITIFDQFQQTFTEITDSIEQNAGGNFEAVQRLSTFYNLPELIQAFRSFADVVTTDDIPEFKADPDNAPPELKGGKAQTIVLPMTSTLKDVMLSIKNKYDEYKNMSGAQKRENSFIPLLLYYIGKVAPIDPRIVNPRLADDPGSKANAAVAEILRLYKAHNSDKAVQMVFSDSIKSSDSENIRDILGIERGGPEFNLYQDIKNKLIEGGIPENEIAILTDSRYDKDEAKKKLFDMANEGTVRVLIGSTEKMGVGVNAQERMIGLHHIDAPGRPDMFTQRNGRILRQGNMFAKKGVPVEVLAYGMEGTRDATAFQRLEKKQGFITQLFKGNITERRSEDAAAEEQDNIDDFFAELGASLSGNKDALKLVMVKKDLRKEENREYSFRQKRYDAERSLRNQERSIPNIKSKIDLAEEVQGSIKKNLPDGEITELTINNEKIEDKFTTELQEKFVDPLITLAEKTGATTPMGQNKTFKVNGMDVMVNVRAYKSAGRALGQTSMVESSYTNLYITVPELNIGTETDEDTSASFNNKGREVKSNSAAGIMAIIRNAIDKAGTQPERWKTLLKKTETNIEQLKQDLTSTYDDGPLKKLREEKRRLDVKILANDGGIREARKLDDDTFYVFDKLEDAEVTVKGEVVYYKTLQAAQQEAQRLNDISKEVIEDPHANIKGVLDFLDNAKIDGGKAFGMIVPIPPVVFNAAIDIIKEAIKAGNTVQQAIRKAVNHLRDNRSTDEQIDDFTALMTEKLGKYSDLLDNPTTTLKNAETDVKRNDYGFEQYRTRGGRTDAVLNQEAEEAISRGYDVYALMDRILDPMEDDAPISDWETVVILKFIALKEAEVQSLNSNFNGDIPDREFAQFTEKRSKALDDLNRAYDAAKETGTSQGSALRARQVKVIRDMTLAGMFTRMRQANGGKKLTTEESQEVTDNYNAIQKSQAALEAKLAALELENAQMRAKEIIKQNMAESRKRAKSATVSQLQEESQDILKDWRKALRDVRSQSLNSSVPYLQELVVSAPFVAKFAKNLVERGFTEITDLVGKIREEFMVEFPDLTERDVLDILAGRYSEAPKTKSELQQEMLEIKKQANLIVRIQDAMDGVERAPAARKAEASARVQALRDQLYDMTRDEKDLRAAKKRAKDRLAELERRIKEGDFEKSPQRTKVEDQELRDIKDQVVAAEFAYTKLLTKKQLAQRSRTQKNWDTIIDVLSVPRSLMSSVDLSAPLRQGLIFSVSHPIIAGQAFVEMLRQAISQKRYDRWLYDIQNSGNFEMMKKSGLYISDINNAKLSAREEEFTSNLAEKIPIVGSTLVKGSQRAYTAFLNKMRADVFMQMADVLEIQGKTFENSPDTYKFLADFVNNATGRGTLGTGKAGEIFTKIAPSLSSIFFSPRLIASRVTLLNPLYYAKVPKELRKMVWGDMAKFVGVATTVLFLMSLIGDDGEDDDITVEWNPLSSDFGKIRQGNTRWDILGGFSQYVRFLSQFILEKRKSTSSGKISDIDSKKFPFKGPMNLPIDFARSKLAPLPAIAWNLKAGEDMVGNPFTWKDIPGSILPLVGQDVYDGVKEKGPGALITTLIPAMFGVGVQTYNPKKKKEDERPRAFNY